MVWHPFLFFPHWSHPRANTGVVDKITRTTDYKTHVILPHMYGLYIILMKTTPKPPYYWVKSTPVWQEIKMIRFKTVQLIADLLLALKKIAGRINQAGKVKKSPLSVFLLFCLHPVYANYMEITVDPVIWGQCSISYIKTWDGMYKNGS